MRDVRVKKRLDLTKPGMRPPRVSGPRRSRLGPRCSVVCGMVLCRRGTQTRNEGLGKIGACHRALGQPAFTRTRSLHNDTQFVLYKCRTQSRCWPTTAVYGTCSCLAEGPSTGIGTNPLFFVLFFCKPQNSKQAATSRVCPLLLVCMCHAQHP